MLDHDYAAMVRPAIDRAHAGMRTGGQAPVIEVLDSKAAVWVERFATNPDDAPKHGCT